MHGRGWCLLLPLWDWLSLFNDAVWTSDDTSVMLMGPRWEVSHDSCKSTYNTRHCLTMRREVSGKETKRSLCKTIIAQKRQLPPKQTYRLYLQEMVKQLECKRFDLVGRG